jgi:cell division protein DivIC
MLLSQHHMGTIKNKFQQYQQQRWFRILTNRYVLVTILFSIWMLFIDTNSLTMQWELKRELRQLEVDKKFFEKEIEANKSALEALTGSDENLEKYARENHLMVRDGEEVFIVPED